VYGSLDCLDQVPGIYFIVCIDIDPRINRKTWKVEVKAMNNEIVDSIKD
jgi:hypothetical protein